MFDHGVLQCWLRILYIMLHTIYSVHDVYPGSRSFLKIITDKIKHLGGSTCTYLLVQNHLNKYHRKYLAHVFAKVYTPHIYPSSLNGILTH